MATKEFSIKTFEYKIRANKKFIAECERVLDSSRFLYNCLLEQRINYYRYSSKGISWVEQSRQLTDARKEFPELSSVAYNIQTDVIKRLDKAYQAFFARGGFPRFKGANRYHTFSQTIEKQRKCPLQGDKLHVPSVGSCRVRLSRELPENSRVKQLRVTRRASGWYALLVCEIPKEKPLPKTGQSVGVDVGISDFATLSNGEAIANPRHLQQHADKLATLQRRASRKRKGSQNRKKANNKVALLHEKVSNARKDFHYKTAKSLVDRFDCIAVEALNIKGMVKNQKLSKAILDVAWSQFFSVVQVKAESAGREFIKINPAYTSQTCSKCGHRQKMPLKVRTFKCGNCLLVIQRDHNAAINILNNTRELREIYACGEHDSVSTKQERVLETSGVPAGQSEPMLLTRC